MVDSPIKSKSSDFALRIVRLYKHLTQSKNEYVLSKQLLRSGTSIGANIAEAEYAQSKADYVAKMSISLKETNETVYWIDLLYKAEYFSETEYNSIHSDAIELLKMLTSIVKNSKANT